MTGLSNSLRKARKWAAGRPALYPPKAIADRPARIERCRFQMHSIRKAFDCANQMRTDIARAMEYQHSVPSWNTAVFLHKHHKYGGLHRIPKKTAIHLRDIPAESSRDSAAVSPALSIIQDIGSPA